MRTRSIFLFPLLLLISMYMAGNAAAAEIHFNNPAFAVGTEVTTEFASLGLEFQATTHSGGPVVLPRVVADPMRTSSGPNVASILQLGCTEFCSAGIAGKFASPRRSIRVFVGLYKQVTDPVRVCLVTYNADGKRLSEKCMSIKWEDGYEKFLSLSFASARIAFFEIYGEKGKPISIDRIVFDTMLEPPSPDFSLAWRDEGLLPVQLTPGGSNVTRLLLHRFGPSKGPISIALTSGPEGLSAELEPSPTNGPEGSEVKVTLHAHYSTKPGSALPVVFTGLPSAEAGSVEHRVTVMVTVRDAFDIGIDGVEVTQGIQSFDLPRRDAPLTSAPVSYLGGTAGGTLQDRGVGLAEGGRTIVRVFASVKRAPTFATLPPVEAVLRVCEASAPVCGTVLAPENGAQVLVADALNTVSDERRKDVDRLAYRFTLPPRTTMGTIRLEAEIFAPTFFSAEMTECIACVNNNKFVLKDVKFTKTVRVPLTAVALLIDYVDLRLPPFVFAGAANMLPLADGGLEIPPTYAGSADITDLAYEDVTFLGGIAADTIRGESVMERLMDRADDWKFFSPKVGEIVGVFSDQWEPSIRARASKRAAIAAGGVVTVPKVYYPNRPLASPAHELFHLLGRRHAGTECGAENSEPWPPDGRGFIGGFGYDRRVGVWRSFEADVSPMAPEYPVVAPHRCTIGGGPACTDGATLYYDLMSYCGETSVRGDPDKWTSVRGWNQMLQALEEPVSLPSAKTLPLPFPGAAPSVSMLVVRALVHPGKVVITKVAPVPPLGIKGNSEYRLVARDAAGAIVQDVPMEKWFTEGQSGAGLPHLAAEVQLARVARVEIVHAGTILAERTRRPDAVQHVNILQPSSGQLLGRGERVQIRWRASPGGRARTVKIDWALDQANEWRPVYFGPDTGQASLPGAHFPAARCGRLRVRINDGFDEVEGVAECVRAEGRPPDVRITSPEPGTRFVKEATMYAGGEAYDDRGIAFEGDALRWSLNGRPAGTGNAISFGDLTDGVSKLALRVTDRLGRQGLRELSVRCQRGQCDVAR